MRTFHTFATALTASAVAAAMVIGLAQNAALAQRATKSTHPGKARKQVASYVHREDEGEVGRVRKAVRRVDDPTVVDVFKDFNAWWDDNRDGATLAALGKVEGTDHFVHPLAELAGGISPNTDVVLITSNSWGQESTRIAQNHPSAQANLESFVRRGGVAIIDMGDNDYGGGFIAPGAIGTPHLVFPSDAANATLTDAAAGEDRLLGTTDDHRLVRGADGAPGTADDLDQSNIDACCYVAHGNLHDGISLPTSADVLMTAVFDGVSKPILAEYCLGYGRVIVDTVTKEFEGHDPVGQGPSRFMSSLLSYAMDPLSQTDCQVSGLIESVRWMQAGKAEALFEAKLKAARQDIDGGKYEAANGKLRAFVNMVRSRRGRGVPAPLADEWIRVASTIMRTISHFA